MFWSYFQFISYTYKYMHCVLAQMRTKTRVEFSFDRMIESNDNSLNYKNQFIYLIQLTS